MSLPELDQIGTYHQQCAAIIASYRDEGADYSYARMQLDDATNDFHNRAVAGGIKKSQICRTVLTQYKDFLILAEARENNFLKKTRVFGELMDVAKHVIEYDEKLSICMVHDLLPDEYKPQEYEAYDQPEGRIRPQSAPNCLPDDW